jgi:hypothetical protein
MMARSMPHARSARPACALVALAAAAAGCSDGHSVPEKPTWADVQPILQGQCSHCHGATAAVDGLGYRLDFYDMTPEVCGDAARALPTVSILAHLAAPLIDADVTPPVGGGPALMPPAPGPALPDWQRETIQRWTLQPDKGPPPKSNRPPAIQVNGLPSAVGRSLAFTALISDPDADEVVGAIEVDNNLFAMNRSGTFAVSFDTTAWAPGQHRISAVLCDGWSSVTYDLGPVDVTH